MAKQLHFKPSSTRPGRSTSSHSIEYMPLIVKEVSVYDSNHSLNWNAEVPCVIVTVTWTNSAKRYFRQAVILRCHLRTANKLNSTTGSKFLPMFFGLWWRFSFSVFQSHDNCTTRIKSATFGNNIHIKWAFDYSPTVPVGIPDRLIGQATRCYAKLNDIVLLHIIALHLKAHMHKQL